MALGYYNIVREASRRRQSGTEAVFNVLRPFFAHSRRTEGEPTVHEVERDVWVLLHGKKDGEVVIKNERPHLVGGVHEVVDETRDSRVAVKETVEESAV